MREEASILHADVDSFFASVEQRRDPSLMGRAVIVGGGVVMAASYEAKACGIHGGMNGARARMLCPQAVVVEPHFSDYGVASRELFDLFRRTAPLVEGLSMEEAFLDVGGLERISGSPARIAGRLRREVRDELELPISVGVARTKSLAKMASRAAKPDGLLVVSPGGEREFLHPLPIEALWGVGDATARRIARLGVRTVGDLADVPETSLVAALGRHAGSHLHALANLREHRPVRTRRRRRSYESQSALGSGQKSLREIEGRLAKSVERASRRMRAAGRSGRTVTLRLRFGDYSRASRSRTLPRATAATVPLLQAAVVLLGEAESQIEARGLTLIGVTIANLDAAACGIQLELPLQSAGADRLDDALDELHGRFGAAAVTRGLAGSRETRESDAERESLISSGGIGAGAAPRAGGR
ncbi:MAG: DNA polymerase IV [Actinomycetota bacterium]|nr:DNA polymerase IV [Actinomycetota bacterium]